MGDGREPSANPLIHSLERQFARLHQLSTDFVRIVPREILYAQPREVSSLFPGYSCGEHILRSGAVVEQTFGGLTANLWDDPFEWTLPEALRSPESVAEYLKEVEETRSRGFALFREDADLLKEVALPSGAPDVLCWLLFDTLRRAAHHQGRAFATFRQLSDDRLPQI